VNDHFYDNLLLLQVVPVKPAEQAHENVDPDVEHLAPFLHGLLAHGSTTTMMAVL
jgi:hypothetical protein